jgi:hypothetical protein
MYNRVLCGSTSCRYIYLTQSRHRINLAANATKPAVRVNPVQPEISNPRQVYSEMSSLPNRLSNYSLTWTVNALSIRVYMACSGFLNRLGEKLMPCQEREHYIAVDLGIHPVEQMSSVRDQRPLCPWHMLRQLCLHQQELFWA